MNFFRIDINFLRKKKTACYSRVLIVTELVVNVTKITVRNDEIYLNELFTVNICCLCMFKAVALFA